MELSGSVSSKCTRCKLDKLRSEFYRRQASPNGLAPICKSCESTLKAVYYKNRTVKVPETKECVTCKQELSVSNFGPRKGSKDGLREYCRTCRKIETKKDYEKHPDRFKANARLRQERLRNRAPSWLTPEHLKEIREFYANRPEGYDVDHIVPINGRNVSGLHVPWNLQYLPSNINRSKGNRFTF